MPVIDYLTHMSMVTICFTDNIKGFVGFVLKPQNESFIYIHQVHAPGIYQESSLSTKAFRKWKSKIQIIGRGRIIILTSHPYSQWRIGKYVIKGLSLGYEFAIINQEGASKHNNQLDNENLRPTDIPCQPKPP